MATDQELCDAGLRTVTNEHATGSALDLGATVLSWRPRGGKEVLFLSREALVGTGDEIHGGVPVCAPWFGSGRAEVQVPHGHGLVRWVPWRLVEQTPERLVWELSHSDVAHLPGASDYPPDLRYRLAAQFTDHLAISLTVRSPTTAFILDQALHTYLRVDDVSLARIEGLEGVPFRDFATDGTVTVEQAPLRLGRHMDRVYHHAGAVTLVEGTRRTRITQQGGANVVVWNPGPKLRFPGFAADEWRSMVCIEVGNVSEQAVHIPSGGSHTLELQIRVDG
ncbi:MAG: hypothetical protein Q4D96_02670 [Propionibacteriaceae bacterium]|nr:hypothetical protein [Propionibacteriaceae bacterium]